MRPSRRQLLELALIAGAGASFAELPSPAATGNPASIETFLPKLRELRDEFRARVCAWVRDGRLVRPDGFLYAVDVAQLMACFVDASDQTGYFRLRRYAGERFVVDDPSDPLTRG